MENFLNILFVIFYFVIFFIVNAADQRRTTERSELEMMVGNYINRGGVIKETLVNEFCEMRYITLGYDYTGNTQTFFYCKEKTNGKKPGRMFYITGSDSHTATMWAIFNMEFDQKSTYSSIRRRYLSIQNNLWNYMYEDSQIIYPPYGPEEAQNEYCRMVLEREENEQGKITCSEIWSKNENKKIFIMRGKYQYLIRLIMFFRASNNIYADFQTLLRTYRYDKNITIEEFGKTNDYEKKNSIENFSIPKTDINNATLQEITALPGVSVIHAKKLIKKREEIGGFKSVNDVIIFLRLKSNIAETIEKRICVNPIKVSKADIKSDERNVDL